MPPRLKAATGALGTRRPQCRQYTLDGRTRLSNWWAPSAKGYNYDYSKEGSHGLLVKAGFVRQAYGGYFHLMPLGLRVQERIEKLIDKHMRSVRASKLALSSVSSVDLWKKTGRLSSETVQLQSRTKQEYLLCPTHEEEITRLLGESNISERDLPLRLYQVSRKYRDEMRPRQGLLRTREFLMKDLYTFDKDEATALATYHEVKDAYVRLFSELGIPFAVAEADSGDIGGSYSHEFHYLSDIGEDTLWKCDSCGYMANDELAHRGPPKRDPSLTTAQVRTHTLDVSIDGEKRTLVLLYPPSDPTLPAEQDLPNISAARRHVAAALDTPVKSWSAAAPEPTKAPNPLYQHLRRRIHIVDPRIAHLTDDLVPEIDRKAALATDLAPLRDNDACPRCETGHLASHRAIELGHTFHLGTRYSTPLDAGFLPLLPGSAATTPFAMGCHGIGISRMLAAIAAVRCDERGMSWPRAAAPWDVAVVYEANRAQKLEGVAEEVYDLLSGHGRPRTIVPGQESDVLDVVLDDRQHGSIIQKMTDADFVGYPVMVVLGRSWVKEGKVEVQCRHLGVKENVDKQDVVQMVRGLLDRC